VNPLLDINERNLKLLIESFIYDRYFVLTEFSFLFFIDLLII